MTTIQILFPALLTMLSPLAGQLPIPPSEKGESVLHVVVRKPDGKPARSYRLRLLRESRAVFAGVGSQVLPKMLQPYLSPFFYDVYIPAVDVDHIAEGHEFKALAAGKYRVEAIATGYAKTVSRVVSVDGTTGKPVHLTFRLLTGGMLTGRVVDEKGNGVAGARVTTWESGVPDMMMKILAPHLVRRTTKGEVKTDKDGRFRLETLTPATYQLRFAHAERVRRSRDGLQVTDRKSLDIGTVTLNKGARVSGTVRHDGKPVAGAVVFLHVRENERVFSLFSRTVTDKEGRFAISDAVAPGSYALSAWRPTAGPVQSFADLRKRPR